MRPSQHHQSDSKARAVRSVRAWLKRGVMPASMQDYWSFLSRAVDHCDLEWRIRELERSYAHGVSGHQFGRF